jgi:type I restriction enzyme M protein
VAKIHLPAEFKDFSEKFDTLAYGQDDSRVFDDMLAYIIDLFSFDNPWEPLGRYKDPEIRKRFFELFQEIVLLMNKKVRDDGEWYDPFGNLYQTQIVSHGRRANAGQFFTPENIVDFMVSINSDGRDLTGKGLNIGDPACGSGRFLIAAHAKFPGNYYCGEDIDRTCALMTVCNFILHGVNGEVIWHDSLMPTKERFYGAWRVRPRPDLLGIPEVSKMEWEDTLCHAVWESRRVKADTAKTSESPAAEAPQIVQLNLF